MKGVSAVVATILILLITVALAASAYVWFNTVFQQTTTTGSQQTQKVGQQITTQFSIASAVYSPTPAPPASCTGDACATLVYLQNTGSQDITPSEVSFFVDNIKAATTTTGVPATFKVGETQLWKIQNATGDYDSKQFCTGKTLKVTGPGGLAQTTTISC